MSDQEAVPASSPAPQAEVADPESFEAVLIDELGLIIQDAHLNFLIGAGTSQPAFKAHSDVENWLTQLDTAEIDPDVADLGRAAIYSHFLEGVGLPSAALAAGKVDEKVESVVASYQAWLQSVHRLLLRRRNSILSKQANVFTTNVDLAIEIAAELAGVETNDGFTGRFAPRFDGRNFGTVRSIRSWHYDNLSEMPTLNLFKLHGSFDWRTVANGDEHGPIIMDADLEKLALASRAAVEVAADVPLIDDTTKMEDFFNLDSPSTDSLNRIHAFLSSYYELQVVNPNKAKFSTTVLNHIYYDLLRIFANELEKENSVLFVVGFSCRDEHLVELIKRAAHTNPTLQILTFPYLSEETIEIRERIVDNADRNDNIRVIEPLPAVKDKWEGRWSLDEFSRRLIESVAPHREPFESNLAEVGSLAGKTRVRDE